MSRVTVDINSYSSQADLVAKVVAFLSANGWTVKPGSGDLGPLEPELTDQTFSDGTWHVLYSDGLNSLNPKWVKSGHERIYLVIGQSDTFNDAINITKGAVNIKVARWADISGVTVPASSVVDHANPSNLEGSDAETFSGFDHTGGSPVYYIATDGSPTTSASYFVLAAETNSSSPAWRAGFFGLGQRPSRFQFAISGTASGNEIELPSASPQAWNPAYMHQSSMKVIIGNQSSTGPSYEQVFITETDGSTLTVDELSDTFTNPVIGTDPQPVISTGTRSVTDDRAVCCNAFLTTANHDDTRCSIGVENIRGESIPAGINSLFNSYPVHSLGSHESGLDVEWMRHGLVSFYVANVASSSTGDIITMPGDAPGKIQDHVLISLEDDPANIKLVIPIEDERSA